MSEPCSKTVKMLFSFLNALRKMKTLLRISVDKLVIGFLLFVWFSVIIAPVKISDYTFLIHIE
jgi:hypothetical protein